MDLLEAGGELAIRGELSTSEEELLDTPDLKSWLSRGAESIEVARRIGELIEENSEAIYPRKDVRFLPPIPNPEKIICIGLNYRDHAEEQNLSLPQIPSSLLSFPAVS